MDGTTEAQNPRAVIGSNEPPADADPLLDRLAETTRDLSAKTRLDKLIAACERVPDELPDDAKAGDAATVYTMLDKARKAFDAQRVEETKPFLESQRKVNAHFKTFLESADDAMRGIKAKVDAYRRKKDAAAAAERQRLEAEARARQAEADKKAAEAKTVEQQAAARRAADEAAALQKKAEATKPVVQGSYGAKASGRKVLRGTVTDHSKLPDIVMKAPKVVEAIDKTIAGLIKAGAREIAGVTITPDTETTIRS
jgi:uncharacterized protein YlxW (UPF0749 family)